MSFTITEQRRITMLERIGGAVELIDNQQFLPFYRGVQIKLEKLGKPEEWAKMIEVAKTKEHPSRYFAMICKMVRDGTYQFVDKVKKVAEGTAKYIGQKISKFNFGKYQQYWVNKSNEFINLNGMGGFVDLLEYADRKHISQKYFAKALLNGKPPAKYYQENVRKAAK